MNARIAVSLVIAAAAMASPAAAGRFEAPYQKLQVVAATVHAPTPRRTIYESTTGQFRLEARFSFGSRTPFYVNTAGYPTEVVSIESGEAYEVRVFLVDTKPSTGWGSVCMGTGPDLPWSFGRGRIDPTDATQLPILGPWTGWVPADQMFQWVYNFVSGSCPPMRATQIYYELNQKRSEVIAGMQAYMADPRPEDFNPAFEAVALQTGKQEVKQVWNNLESSARMIELDAQHDADDKEDAVAMMEGDMVEIPCAAPPNDVAVDHCKALQQQIDQLKKEVVELRAEQERAKETVAEAKAQAQAIQDIQVNATWIQTLCGGSADVMRGITTFVLSRITAAASRPIMLYQIRGNAIVSAICMTGQFRIYAMNPTPLSAAYMQNQVARAAAIYVVDSGLLYLERNAALLACSAVGPPAPACTSGVRATYLAAWWQSGLILVGAFIANYLLNAAIIPNAPAFGI